MSSVRSKDMDCGAQGTVAASARASAVVSAWFSVWLRSPIWAAGAVALIISGLTMGLLVLSGPVSWERVLAHQNMWVVAIGPGFLAAVAAYICIVERNSARVLSVRAVDPSLKSAAGSLILLWWTLVLYLTHFLTALLCYWILTGLSLGSILDPVRDMLALTAICLAAAVGYIVCLRLVTEAAGPAAAVVTALIVVISGVLTAETSVWPFVPSAWLIRPTLTLLGTHANGTALGGEPVSGTGWAIALSIAIGLLLCFVRVALARWSEHRMRRAAIPHRNGRRIPPANYRERGSASARVSRITIPCGRSVCGAALRRSGIGVLVVACIAVIAWLRLYLTPDNTVLVFGLFILPLGCGILPTIAISRWQGGMRAVATRAPSVTTHALRLITIEGGIVVLAVIGSVLAAYGLTPTIGGLLRAIAALSIFGMMLLSFSTWLMSTAGTLLTLMITVAGTIAGLLVGGNQALRHQVGLFVPWSWAANLTDPSLLLTLVIAVLATAIFSAASIHRLAKNTSDMG
ncbi:ABC-2 family transporter permease [Devriesea agamarum]|uniref:ABC transporter permease n=1 Tax=Devriesea agamarum TaxID=472569 RepID=UPI00071E607A|nr:ABC transporter permease [Devriesea agamarum]